MKMKSSLPFKYITTVKDGKHYVVFDYKDNEGKRKRKWIGTDLPEKCAKKALNLKVEEISWRLSSQLLPKQHTKAIRRSSTVWFSTSIRCFLTLRLLR